MKTRKRWLVAVAMLGAMVASAAAPRAVQIKRRNGEVVRGTIVSEMETGYLLKLESGTTQAVKFDDVADLTELGAAPPPGLAPPPPPARPTGPCLAHEVYLQLDPRDAETRMCIGRTETTVADYDACVKAGQCNTEGLDCGAANYGRPDRQNHPINCTSYFQAEAFCAWRGARLPSFDEFKQIADSVVPGTYSWGDDEPLGHACWSGDDSRSGTCPAGSFPKGAGRGGVLDIVGNVWEWTTDEKRRDRVFAGGSWAEKKNKKLLRDSRNWASPGSHMEDLGFRCVRPLTPVR